MSINVGFGNRTKLSPIIDINKTPKNRIVRVNEMTYRRMKGLSGRFNVASNSELIDYLLDFYDQNNSTVYSKWNKMVSKCFLEKWNIVMETRSSNSSEDKEKKK